MKPLILVCFISVFVVGCNPPHFDNCITDLNKIDRAILDAPENISKAEILQIIHETKANVCQPFDPKLPLSLVVCCSYGLFQYSYCKCSTSQLVFNRK